MILEHFSHFLFVFLFLNWRFFLNMVHYFSSTPSRLHVCTNPFISDSSYRLILFARYFPMKMLLRYLYILENIVLVK